jgi:tyrosine aminotransferase
MAPISIADMTVRPTATTAAKAAQQGAHNGVTTETRGGGWKPVHMSSVVKSIRNPIREAIAGIDLSAPPSGEKPLINISLGDPTVFGNLPPPPAALMSIIASLESGKSHGYPQSAGYPIALQAVSDYFDEGYMGGNWRVRTEDVVMTHGASGALEMAFHVLADKSKNVLMPRPGFSSYETMVTTTQAEVRFYDLIADNNWEVDLVQLESLIDENTAFVLLNK